MTYRRNGSKVASVDEEEFVSLGLREHVDAEEQICSLPNLGEK
jgi:hypothetical protein